VLGAGIQTCLHLIREGAIGEPVGASAFMLSPGHERWHPNPEFFYQVGGGPMLDMGPYYITTLVTLLGAARRVATITVETPTHITGVIEFENGVLATVIMSFDVWAHRLPCIEIYGTEGTLGVPDPNGFGGPVLLRKAGESEWREMPLTHPYAEQYRSLGLAEMIRAIHEGRPNRLNGQLAYHVLDIMLAFNDSSASGAHVRLESTCTPPAPMPTEGLDAAV
jgi:predicted dehydrogenase